MESEREQEEQEEEEEEFKDQEFTYQNPIPKNPEVETSNLQTQQYLNLENPEIRTLNIQALPNQDNSNPKLINQQNLLLKQRTMHKYGSTILKKPLQPMDRITRELYRPSHISYRILPTCANLSTTSLLANNTHNLSTIVPAYLLATVLSNLSTPTNLNTATKLTSKWNPKAKTDTTELEIVDGSPSTDPQFLNPAIKILTMKFGHQQPLTNNILPATISNNESLVAIFPFEFKETTPVPLFSGATLDTKLITAMYTDAKVDGHAIKLILDSGSAGSIITQQLMDQLGCQVDYTASVCIITVDGTTKTPIGEIDDLPIEVNGIIVPIKVLVMEAT
ncbi:hypothetical protein G9A89_008589 [Geosiphon pyriformis]|nr:hypothetical protein G9A89_008589 [Geosiphon pyriformis]